jgi:DNA-binding HxlR family transcriptional regulator
LEAAIELPIVLRTGLRWDAKAPPPKETAMRKDADAVNQLFELLEARYAIRVLWALGDGHPQTFRLLQDSVGNITPNTLNTRIKELRSAQLLDHGGSGYQLTPHGLDLVRRLGELKPFAKRWQHHTETRGRVAVRASPRKTRSPQ